ncbi:unnamed protein product [Chrysoparadoxa australica]
MARIDLEIWLGPEHRDAVGDTLARQGIAPLEDGLLRVTRELSAKGSAKNAAYLNGTPVKVTALRDICQPLIKTVDANAIQMFSRGDSRRKLVDRLLTPEENKVLPQMARCVGQLKLAEGRVRRLEEQSQRKKGSSDAETEALLAHWVEELDTLEADEFSFVEGVQGAIEEFISEVGEDDLGELATLSEMQLKGDESSGASALETVWPALQMMSDCLKEVESSRESVLRAARLMTEKSDPSSVLGVIGEVHDLVIDAAQGTAVGAQQQEALEGAHELLNQAEALVCTAGDQLDALVAGLPRLPVTLEEIEGHIMVWKDLSRKHGISPPDLGKMHRDLRDELDEFVSAQQALPKALEQQQMWREEAGKCADLLHTARVRAAHQIEALLNPHLAGVGMEGASIRVAVDDGGVLSPQGVDKVQFEFSSQGGQAHLPIEAVASSGERSRLLLLMESLLPTPPTGDVRISPCAVLYDEIDAHVGGRTAVSVGKLLAMQGKSCQVLVVTHTAPVAAQADQHLVVDKVKARHSSENPSGAQTEEDESEVEESEAPHSVSITVRDVQGSEREEEVARMASGDTSVKAMDLARTLLEKG